MTKKKIYALVILALITVFMLLAFLLSSQRVYAAPLDDVQVVADDGEDESLDGTEGSSEQSTAPTAESVSESVKQYLVSVYGEQWEDYYNQIIERWGSIEQYLLNASENLPDEYKYTAQEIIVNAGGYVPLIAYSILIVGGIAVIVYQYLKNKKISRELNSIEAEQDQEITGDLAIMDGIKAIFTVLKDLTPGEQFEGARAAVESAEATINKASEDIKKDA